jgi:hypothetical protein
MDLTALLGSWVATHHPSMHLGELSCCDVQGLSSSAICKARSYPATVQISFVQIGWWWWWLLSSLLSNAQLGLVSWHTECNCQKHDRSKTVVNIRIRRDYNPTSCQLISSPTSTTFACTQYKNTHVLIHLKNSGRYTHRG